jgi:Fe-S cluster biogenesis protein NfuA
VSQLERLVTDHHVPRRCNQELANETSSKIIFSSALLVEVDDLYLTTGSKSASHASIDCAIGGSGSKTIPCWTQAQSAFRCVLYMQRGLMLSSLVARSMFIQTETTPNDDSLKFIPGVDVMGDGGTAEFLDTRSALASPLAIRLIGIEGAKAVFFGPDFVTVSKDSEHSWAVIKPEVYSTLMEFFSSGQPLFRSEQERQAAGPQDTRILDTDSETVAMIKELLETRVRPSIMEHGGDIEYRGFGEDGMVRVKLRGSCRGCDTSTVTLKSGIERILMHYIPEVKGVEQVSRSRIPTLTAADTFFPLEIMDQDEEMALSEFSKLEQRLAEKQPEAPT